MVEIEKFEPLIHSGRLQDFANRLAVESLLEVDAHRFSNDLGFSEAQVINQSLVESMESYVFMEDNRVRGACGISRKYTQQTYFMVPWFLTDGFEREDENRWEFLCISCILMKHWVQQVPPSISFCNICLDNPRITKWLTRWLGFKISPIAAKIFRGHSFKWFHAKGGDLSVYSVCRSNTCPSEHGKHISGHQSPGNRGSTRCSGHGCSGTTATPA